MDHLQRVFNNLLKNAIPDDIEGLLDIEVRRKGVDPIVDPKDIGKQVGRRSTARGASAAA